MTTVTDDQISTRIVEVTYLSHKRITVCLVELDNGFVVLGDAACIDQKRFDAGLGRTLAYSRARSKLWAYFGFALAEQLLALHGRGESRQPFEHDPMREPGESRHTDEVMNAALDADDDRRAAALRLAAEEAHGIVRDFEGQQTELREPRPFI